MVARRNLFGIKGSNPETGANTGQVGTWEDYGNGPVQIKDTFRAYDSVAQSFMDFAKLIQNRVLRKEITQACGIVCKRREVRTYLQVCSDCAPARGRAGATSIQWVEWT